MQFPSLKAKSNSPVLFIAFYCTATIVLLFFNKWLFTHNREFSFVLTITWLQQIGVVMLLLLFRRLLEPIMGDIAMSKIVFKRVAPVGILAATDYSFSNLALKIIPMTIYEIVKSCAPAVVLILSILLGLMQPSLKLSMVVVLIVVGAIIAVYHPPKETADGGKTSPLAVSVEGLILVIAGAVGSAMKSVAAQMSLHGSKAQLKKELVKTGGVSANSSIKGRVLLTENGKLSNSYRSREAMLAAEEGSGDSHALSASFAQSDREAYEHYGPVNPITVAFFCGIVMSFVLLPIVYIREGAGVAVWWNTVPHATKAKNLSYVGLSSVMSILVSVSSFLVMRETSALTYAIVALGERIMIVIVAIILLGEDLPLTNAMGFAVTLGGIAWYNQMKSHSHSAAPKEAEDANLVRGGSVRAPSAALDPLTSPIEPFKQIRFDDKRKFSLSSAPNETLFVPAASDFDTSEDESELPDRPAGYGAVDEQTQVGSPEANPLSKNF